jgi:hypothetical protein
MCTADSCGAPSTGQSMTAMTDAMNVSVNGHSVAYRMYMEARRSVAVALVLLVLLGGCLAAFIMSMPALQVLLQCPCCLSNQYGCPCNLPMAGHKPGTRQGPAQPTSPGATATNQPPSCLAVQPEERQAFQHFPPRSLQHLVAQRDILLNYAAVNPVRSPWDELNSVLSLQLC